MNVSNNHIVESSFLDKLGGDTQKEYEKVPKHLNHAAKVKLAGMKEARVSFNSGGKLSKWAKKKREERKKLAMSGKL